MALQKQLSQEEWDILSIFTDPILLGEYLRNTGDGSPNRDEWQKIRWKYRWYQKDLLSDTSEFISLIAGRAVGKCSPMHARVYVYPYGYVTIKDLLTWKKNDRKNIAAYTVDNKNQLTQRRLGLEKNGYKNVFRVTTSMSHIFEGTANHPILTPAGYKHIEELHVGDQVAVITKLPHESMQNLLSWEELRYLGYIMGYETAASEMRLVIKYNKNVAELQQIADYFDARLVHNSDGTYTLLRKRGPLKHYMTKFFMDFDLESVPSHGFMRIPYFLKAERLENIKIFLESFLATFAELSLDKIAITHTKKTFIYDMQELLLRFGAESRVTKRAKDWLLEIDQYQDIYAIFSELDIPGVSVRNLKLPNKLDQATEYMRYDHIISIEFLGNMPTFAVYVPDTHNYISDNLLVHNSIVLEDRLIYEAVNAENIFPMTRESTLVTANQKQMDPLLDRLIARLTNSRLLKDFLKGGINRSKGTLDFPIGGGNYKLNARIAGPKGEANMVGLHVPKIYGDEMQLFPQAAFTQLEPTYNSNEPNAGQFFCGVPNGITDGNVLYYLDQITTRFKKYRIPAHENPVYTRSNDIENIKKYIGEESNEYQRLILGRHGDPAFSMIPRDKIITEPYEFYSYRFSQTDKHNGKTYKQSIINRKIPDNKSVIKILAVDPGYTDPTLMQVICQDTQGKWRTVARYRFTRIQFPEQAEIIDWLDNFYGFNIICIDLGAGGGGIPLSQDLMSDRFPRSRGYSKRVHGVQFAEFIEQGETSDGIPLKMRAKSFAGEELARIITEGTMIFSEIDVEGISQVGRVAYQKRPDGSNQYFVMSERGNGKSKDDHIFASYVVFIITLLTRMLEKPRKKLFGARWL